MNLHLHVDDLENPEEIRDACSRRATELQDEFPETTRLEATLQRVGVEYEMHVRAHGKDLEVASRGRAADALGSVNEAFEKTRRQLRKHHDKLIFGPRRGSPRSNR